MKIITGTCLAIGLLTIFFNVHVWKYALMNFYLPRVVARRIGKKEKVEGTWAEIIWTLPEWLLQDFPAFI